MNRFFYLAYRMIAWPILWAAFRILSPFISKVKQGLLVRRAVSGAKPWATGLHKDGAIWIHCASGEFEYAKPVITLLKNENPTAFILVTYFSTSYVKQIQNFPGVDACCPLPWDTPKSINEFLDYHKPSKLLIARTDVWPEMARQTARRNIPSLLFSATLTKQSGRARGLGRWMSRATFSNLSAIFAVSREDADVFASLDLKNDLENECGNSRAHTQVREAGDTRYDQVIQRLAKPKPIKDSLFPSAEAHLPIIVCGSTWAEDEAVLLPAILRMKGQARFVLVPHEPTPEHLASLESQLTKLGLTSCRYTQSETWTSDVLLIDTMGILAELYMKGDLAFVGGSFKKNIHSVMEPLAAGCLTLVGPYHSNNREALALKEAVVATAMDAVTGTPKTLTAVTPVHNSSELIKTMGEILSQNVPALKVRIKKEIQSRTGASRSVVDWIL